MRAMGKVFLLAVAVLTVSASASADLVLTLTPDKATYLPGETGTLEVFVTASTGSTEEVIGYNLDISATSGATFGGDGSVAAGPAPYLFTGSSPFVTSASGSQSVAYNDEAANFPSGTDVTSSTVFGVGQITFTVSPTVIPGSQITFTVDSSSAFVSSDFQVIDYTATPTAITVAAVPEPSSLALLGLTGAGVLVWKRQRGGGVTGTGLA